MTNELENLFDDVEIESIELNEVETNDESDNHIPVAFQIQKIKGGCMLTSKNVETIDTIYTKKWNNDANTTQRKAQEKAWMLTGINKNAVLIVIKIYAANLNIANKECWRSDKQAA